MANGEKLFYQDNKTGYSLVLGFILLNIAATIFTLKSMYIDYNIGIFTLYNIILTLLSFLAAVKLKKYSLNWAIFSLMICFLQVIRSFRIPELKNSDMKQLIVILMLSSTVLLFLGGITTIAKVKVKKKYLEHKKA
ncbi:MAG: hypothetical protein K0R92_1776 [Lachnospiraceae bacterium]|jgi:hypothetical protein|nr:hypothetical protein [Lachnospiraceae bacterium]